MYHLSRFRPIWGIGVIALLFVVIMGSTPSSAHAAPADDFSGILNKGHAAGSTPATVNDVLDSDIVLFVQTGSTSLKFNYAAEGWLHLVPKGTGYSGFFVDNFAGGKTYAASATGVSATNEKGTYTINTGNGKFVATITSVKTTTIAPTKYGQNVSASLLIAPHSYVRNPAATLSFNQESYGFFVPSVTGTLILTTDSAGVIVSNNKKMGVVSTFTTTIGTHSVVTPITAWGAYSLSKVGNQFMGTIKVGGHSFFFRSQPSNGSTITGTVLSPSGTSFIYSDFIIQ